MTERDAGAPPLPWLFDAALRASYLSEPLFLEQLARPIWDDWHSKWESFVPCAMRERWDELPMDVRLAVYLTARAAFSSIDLE